MPFLVTFIFLILIIRSKVLIRKINSDVIYLLHHQFVILRIDMTNLNFMLNFQTSTLKRNLETHQAVKDLVSVGLQQHLRAQ